MSSIFAPPGAAPVDKAPSRTRAWATRLAQLRITDAQKFLLLALLIGIFSGVLVVLFHIFIDVVSWTTLGALSGRFRYGRLLTPAAGAVVAVLLVRRVFPKAKGSGVNQTKMAIYAWDGYISTSTIAGKFLACGISIGTGNSLGPEDPSLQMGAGVASRLGRLFALPRGNMRLIAPVGAAAGIAAAFNTPITGVLFVMEEVLADWSATAIGSIVLAAVSAVVTMRTFLGNEPLFVIPTFELNSTAELLVYAAIGVAGGVLSAMVMRLIRFSREHIDALPHWRHYALPAVCGFLTGLVGLWFPEVMGAGYDALNSALHGQFPWVFLLYLCAAKLLVTLLCFSAETPGGMFAPALFIGGMIGGGLGGLAHRFLPIGAAPAEAYMLVGMGAFFAGMFRAPITSIFMVFELSASYVIILPVMVANITAYLLSRKLSPVPFFKMLAEMEGVNLPSAEDKRNFQPLRVENAMQRAATPVAKEPGMTLYPDEPLDAALRLLSLQPSVQVISRVESDVVLGTVTLDDVHRAYGISEGVTAGR